MCGARAPLPAAPVPDRRGAPECGGRASARPPPRRRAPDDPTTWHIDDQWLLGEHLLVAPQLEPSGRRRAYLPEGRWLDWWTDEVVDGGRWVTVDSPIDQIPLWMRDGGIIALGPAMGHVDQLPTDRLTLRGLAPTAGRTTRGLIGLPDRTVAWTWDHELHLDLGDIEIDDRLL